MGMDNEIEVKFYPVDVSEINRKLNKCRATAVQERTLMKRVVYGGEVNPQITATYIRVRDEGGKVRMSAKINAKKDGNILDQKELQITVADFNEAIAFLDTCGLKRSNYQENYRTVWECNDCEIVIDEWPGLKPYIEIEGPSIEVLQACAKKLGVKWDSHQIISTDELFAAERNISKQEALKLMEYLSWES